MASEARIKITADAGEAKKEVRELGRSISGVARNASKSGSAMQSGSGSSRKNPGEASASGAVSSSPRNEFQNVARVISDSNKRFGIKIDNLIKVIANSTTRPGSNNGGTGGNAASAGGNNANRGSDRSTESLSQRMINSYRNRNRNNDNNNGANNSGGSGDGFQSQNEANNGGNAGGSGDSGVNSGRLISDLTSRLGGFFGGSNLGGTMASIGGAVAKFGPAIGALSLAIKTVGAAAKETRETDRQAFEVYNRTNMFGSEIEEGKSYALDIGRHYGKDSEDVMAVQDMYMSQAGFKGEEKLTNDTHAIMNLSKNYGLDEVQTASTFGSMAKSGAVSDQTRFANQIASSIKKQNMAGREGETIDALENMADYLKSNLVNINQGQIETMGELHNIFASTNENLKGLAGSQMVTDVGAALQDSGLGKMVSLQMAEEELGSNASAMEKTMRAAEIREEGSGNEQYMAGTARQLEAIYGNIEDTDEYLANLQNYWHNVAGFSASQSKELALANKDMAKIDQNGAEDYSAGIEAQSELRSNYAQSDEYTRNQASAGFQGIWQAIGDWGNDRLASMASPIADASMQHAANKRISEGKEVSSMGKEAYERDIENYKNSTNYYNRGAEDLAARYTNDSGYQAPKIEEAKSVIEETPATPVMTGSHYDYSSSPKSGLAPTATIPVEQVTNSVKSSPLETSSVRTGSQAPTVSDVSNVVSVKGDYVIKIHDFLVKRFGNSTHEPSNIDALSTIVPLGYLPISERESLVSKIPNPEQPQAVVDLEEYKKGKADKQLGLSPAEQKLHNNSKLLEETRKKTIDKYAELLLQEKQVLDERNNPLSSSLGTDIGSSVTTSNNIQESKSKNIFESIFGIFKGTLGGIAGGGSLNPLSMAGSLIGGVAGSLAGSDSSATLSSGASSDNSSLVNRDIEAMRPTGKITTDGKYTYRDAEQVSPEEYEYIAQLMAAESLSHGYEGMLAVGNVLRNRKESSKFKGSTYTDIINAKGQFSPAKNGKIVSKAKPTAETYKALDDMLAGKNNVDDSTYFRARKGYSGSGQEKREKSGKAVRTYEYANPNKAEDSHIFLRDPTDKSLSKYAKGSTMSEKHSAAEPIKTQSSSVKQETASKSTLSNYQVQGSGMSKNATAPKGSVVQMETKNKAAPLNTISKPGKEPIFKANTNPAVEADKAFQAEMDSPSDESGKQKKVQRENIQSAASAMLTPTTGGSEGGWRGELRIVVEGDVENMSSDNEELIVASVVNQMMQGQNKKVLSDLSFSFRRDAQ